MTTGVLRWLRRRGWHYAAVALLILVAFWLRVSYIRLVDLHVDEFTTLWTARRILESGTPIMPSGLFYSRGLLTSYLTAAFMALFGVSDVVGRIPGLLAGLAGVGVIFWIGRREWNARVGLLAALALALLPEAIDAAGRARFYAQLLLWVLLMLWAGYRTARHPDRGWRLPLLTLLFFVLALFTQAETILLFPSLLLALLLWNGPRVLMHLPVAVSQLGMLSAIAVRYWVERIGPVDSFGAVQTSKPYVGLFFDWQSAWDAYGQLFFAVPRVGWTVFAAVAVSLALFQLWRRSGRLQRLENRHQATLYFALHLLWIGVLMATVVGPSWHDPRYILMVQSCWLLLGAAGAVGLIDLLTENPRMQWAIAASVAVAVVLSMWPLTAATLTTQTDGYEEAFAFVAQHRNAGDRIATPQPTACAWVLGTPCDYYARVLDFEPYTVRSAAGPVDRWTGAHLLRSDDDLRLALASGSRLWLVTDRDRLASRYDSVTMQLILEQFDEVFSVDGALVLLAQGLRSGPKYAGANTLHRTHALGGLLLTDWAMTETRPGRPTYVRLDWLQDGTLRTQINTSLQLVAQNGTRVSQSDGPPARGWIQPEDWHEQPVPDFKVLTIPPDLAEGWYRFEVVAYDALSHDPLGEPIPIHWLHIGADPPSDRELFAAWTNGATLAGVTGLPPWLTPGDTVQLALDWQTHQPVGGDQTLFVHLIGPQDMLFAQHDKMPLQGFYPTSAWTPGTRLRDSYLLELPELLPDGVYTLIVGWYDPVTGRRTPTVDGDDGFVLATWLLGS